MDRRLAAILAADVVGYSKLMAEDEAGTLAALKAHRKELFDPVTARFHGRIVKLMGDGVLVEFPSVVDAVECALTIQQALAADNDKIRLRIGINLGDILIDGDDIYGDGVNVAARLEALAKPGGVCISSIVRESLGKRVEANFTDAGEHRVKNMPRPIRVFSWQPGDGPQTAKRAQRGPVAEKPSIAVLPFDNMSDDPEQEYFSDGITEDIITSLSHFHEFFVIARNSTFTYKGQPVRVDQVCRDLGVRYLLEGSVRKAANRVRVTAQLIDGDTGAHLWAARIDRDLDDIFAVQDEITKAIVSAVAPETIGAEQKRSQAKHNNDLNAWEKVMRARWHIAKLTSDDNKAARQLLKEAIAAAPDMSEAYSTLAICHLNDMLHVWRTDTPAAIMAADAAAAQAMALDPSDAGALAVLGMTSLFSRKFDDALEYLNRAIQHNPNLANAYGVLAAVHGVSGDFTASASAAKLASTLSPRDPSKAFWFAGKGIAAYTSGRYEECVEITRMVLRDHPGYASALRQLTAALAMLGRKEEAKEALEALLERMPGLTIAKVRPIVPIRYPDAMERWLEGLRRAGLPE